MVNDIISGSSNRRGPYVFAIAFTQLTEGTRVGELHFNTVFESMYSLLLFGTLLDNVGLLTNRLGKESVFYAVLFFMLIARFVMGYLCKQQTFLWY